MATIEPANILDLYRDKAAKERESWLFKRVSIVDVLTNPEPPHRFRWGKIVPEGALTLVSGHGGTGKSRFALQLACHLALGKDFMELNVEKSKVLFFSAEDNKGVIRERLAAICKEFGFDPVELDENLAAFDSTEASLLWDEAGETYGMEVLKLLLDRLGSEVVIIDNASDTYGGDPINRAQVTQYIRALVNLGAERKASTVMLGHVNRASAQGRGPKGENYADSAAWHNAARSRASVSVDSGGNVVFTHEKSNYGILEPTFTMEVLDSGCLKLTMGKRITTPEERLSQSASMVENYLVSQLKASPPVRHTRTTLIANLKDSGMGRDEVNAAVSSLISNANPKTYTGVEERKGDKPPSSRGGSPGKYLHPHALDRPTSRNELSGYAQ